MENYNDAHTVVPNDLVDKYLHLFKRKEQWNAVLDLIKQSYRAGLQIGRSEKYTNE